MRQNKLNSKMQINDLNIDCIIGILPFERIHKQKLIIDIEIRFSLLESARSADLGSSLDYRKILEEVTQVLNSAKFALIESACLAVLYVVSSMCEFENTLSVNIKKPLALARIATPAVSMQLCSSEFNDVFPKSTCVMNEVTIKRLKSGVIGVEQP